MAEIAFDRQMGVPRGGWCVAALRRTCGMRADVAC
jgi:hypothetical protein